MIFNNRVKNINKLVLLEVGVAPQKDALRAPNYISTPIAKILGSPLIIN